MWGVARVPRSVWSPLVWESSGTSWAPLPRVRSYASTASAGSLPTRKPPAATSFVDFAWGAQHDVAAVLALQDGASSVQRLHALSVLALDLWPRESPHWRVSGPLVLPQGASGAKRFAQEAPGSLRPLARASCLRALCAFRGGPQFVRRAMPFMTALVGSGGASGSKAGLASQLPLDELRRCIVALAGVEVPLRDSPLRDFVSEGLQRLKVVAWNMPFSELHDLQVALKQCGIETESLDNELRRRLRLLTVAASGGATSHSKAHLDLKSDMVAFVSCAQAMQEFGIFRTPLLRQALLPGSLQPGVAAELLQHALPPMGPLSTVHEFVIAMSVGQIVAGARQLEVHRLSSALQGVLALQAQGCDFAIKQASKVLRALWPRVAHKLPHFGPSELSAALRSYWWQIQYSRQEFALTGILHDHPIVGVGAEGARSQSPLAEHQATENLKSRLLRPAFSQLGQMPLQHVAACLTAVAPPVRLPNILNDDDVALLCEEVRLAFPQQAILSHHSGLEFPAWQEEFWLGELQALSTVELLELTCGIREFGGGAPWVINSLLAELQQRLRPAGRSQPSTELSHFLLLRLCRVMDLWQGHKVEEILKQLFSNPEAVRPLPTPYFVAVLQALCQFSVPKELPLRMVSSFLDRVDQGERVVQPEHWVEILAAIRPVDEPPSWERAVPRIIQHLVPHVGSLSAPALALVLQSCALKPYPVDIHASSGTTLGYSALERAPSVATNAVRKAIDSRKWDFQEVVSVFNSLGCLGWYDDLAVAAILAQCVQTPFLEPHALLMLPLARSSVALRVHHAPLLHKMVLWYNWCYRFLRSKPLHSDLLDELLEFADRLLELSFQSLELHGILAENLKNPNASPRQLLALLAVLARFSHFPPEFKETCAKVCTSSTDSDLASLTQSDLVNAFNIHLCAVFDGPAALKHWLTEDAGMKDFFQVHTSQKWYQRQDQERTVFLQSAAYLSLQKTAEEEGLDLQPSDPGEVYHVELVSRDAKERLRSWSNNPPTALVCIKSREQLRWYIPITAEEPGESEQMQNRCHQFRFMFGGAVQKMRHLGAMGYRPAVVWMSEWNALTVQEKRKEYLRAAVGAPGPRSSAFSPSSAEDEDMYR